MPTTHLALRCSQRNISPDIIHMAVTYGLYIRDGKRTRVLVLNRTLRHLRSEGLPERKVRKLGSIMVILDEDETPMTAYYPSKARVRQTRRFIKGIVRGV